MSNPSDFVIENGVLTKYVGPGGDVVVPNGVTVIASNAFKGCANLTGIVISESVTEIGDFAFCACKDLLNVTFPNILESIGNNAFFNCKNLTNLTIPKSVKSIGSGAFGGCEKLVSISIPDNLTSIGHSAFSGCKSLAEFVIPSSITDIKLGTFSGCQSLKSLAIPEGVVNIEDDAFSGCSGLTEIILPSGITKINRRVFERCKSLARVSIPDCVTDIGRGAFSRCESLESITIPEGITNLGDWAFFECGSLSNVTIPTGVKNIGGSTFARCGSLTEIAIPEGVTEIDKEAFFSCTNLRSVHLPDSIVKIGESAFACCPSLSEITISDHAGKYRSIDGVLFSKDGKKLIAFPAGHKGDTYVVPDQTEQITPYAFYGAERLKRITLPQSLKSIGGNAFKRVGIPFLTVPRSVAKLPQKAFNTSATEQIDDLHAISCVIPYVAVYAADMVGALVRPIYIGGPLTDIPAKLKNSAVEGFFYAVQHEVVDILPFRQSYLDHIKRNSKTYAKQAGEDEPVLHLMVEEALLSDKDVESLLDKFTAQNRPDLIAELLDYQNVQFVGKKVRSSAFYVSGEAKRLQKMLERRETIKRQKGIKGIAFVQTGVLQEFGYYDEYTGAKDMSDLKEYIEDRGGFLRSAVSSNTDYLICNDPNSNSTKSQKAKELGVPVITEEEFLRMANEKE